MDYINTRCLQAYDCWCGGLILHTVISVSQIADQVVCCRLSNNMAITCITILFTYGHTLKIMSLSIPTHNFATIYISFYDNIHTKYMGDGLGLGLYIVINYSSRAIQ